MCQKQCSHKKHKLLYNIVNFRVGYGVAYVAILRVLA